MPSAVVVPRACVLLRRAQLVVAAASLLGLGAVWMVVGVEGCPISEAGRTALARDPEFLAATIGLTRGSLIALAVVTFSVAFRATNAWLFPSTGSPALFSSTRAALGILFQERTIVRRFDPVIRDVRAKCARLRRKGFEARAAMMRAIGLARLLLAVLLHGLRVLGPLTRHAG
ncbi:MAG TPA: hypothetical protein VKE69_11710 [Planctomycetota bacterium]|nr:hypothetical protein [Planctomycetota bacterium]